MRVYSPFVTRPVRPRCRAGLQYLAGRIGRRATTTRCAAPVMKRHGLCTQAYIYGEFRECLGKNKIAPHASKGGTLTSWRGGVSSRCRARATTASRATSKLRRGVVCTRENVLSEFQRIPSMLKSGCLVSFHGREPCEHTESRVAVPPCVLPPRARGRRYLLTSISASRHSRARTNSLNFAISRG